MRGLDGKIGRQAFAYLNLTAFCSCYGRWKVDAILGLGDERFADDGNGFRQTLPAHGFSRLWQGMECNFVGRCITTSPAKRKQECNNL